MKSYLPLTGFRGGIPGRAFTTAPMAPGFRCILPPMTLLESTPALPGPYRPPWWASNPHFQTLAGKFLRPEPPLEYIRERWETPDGDFLDVDFRPDQGGPLVLVLHGLEGHSRRRYVLNTVVALEAAGLSAAALNFRSCSGEPNRLPRAYHSGETGDLGLVLNRLQGRFPGRRLGVVGFSLGGNILLKYLGERADGIEPENAPGPLPEAGVAISVPYDLAAGADLLARTAMGRVYGRYFLDSLVEKVRRKAPILESAVDLDAVLRSRTLREFDDRLTAPVHGFRDASDYYASSSSDRFLPAIRTPTLLLHAEDDPFLPPARIPRETMRSNPRLYPVLAGRGGHVGFLQGGLRRRRFWCEEAAASFLASILAGSAPND